MKRNKLIGTSNKYKNCGRADIKDKASKQFSMTITWPQAI